MPRASLACSLALGCVLAAADTRYPALAQEAAPPPTPAPAETPKNVLPPVKVEPLAPTPSKAPRAPAKKRPRAAQETGRAQATPKLPAAPVPATGGGGNGSGAVSLPSMNDLSPAASAQPAASTTLDAAQIARIPITSYGDIFRPLPGFDVSNYGQGAIAYGISLRGYTDGEHGRDIAYFIDGVPVNEISSIHTPNYADLNPLIPETVKSMEIIRGPFAIEAGDSNVGGSVFITTKSQDPYVTGTISGGTYGTGRGLATYGAEMGSYDPYLVVEGYHTDGYRDNSTIDRYNTFDKVTIPVGGGDTLTFRVQAYGVTSGAAGYLNRDALQAGLVSPTAAVNDTDGYDKTLQNIVVQYASGPLDQQLTGLFYTVHTVSTRYADFCTDVACQTMQNEERESLGGGVRKIWTGQAEGFPVQILTGATWRTDFIDDFDAPTVDRHISGAPTINMSTVETNLAAYAQLQVKLLPWLKLTGGSRIDQFYYNIDNRLDPAAEPNIAPTIFSPKAGLSVTPFSWLELYTNYGQGFRSPDAVSELVPNYPIAIQPFKIESEEVGAKIQEGPVKLQASFYRTDASNEAHQPAEGLPVTLIGQTRREGYDLEGRYEVFKEEASVIALFASFSPVDAYRLQGSGGFVPSVPVYTSKAGITFNVAMGGGEFVSGDAYIAFIGKKYLTEDGGQTTSPYQRVAAKVSYAWPSGWSAFTQATWYPGNRYSEAAFNFGDEAHATSADIYVGPAPEIVVLAGFSYRTPTYKLAESFKE